jgi:biotin carboxylase
VSKTLLVLAASIYQLPAIRAAKALGYRVVATDNVPTNPGHALADASHGVDTTDQRAVLELAKEERIDGIVAPGTDVAVETAAYVAEQLGLPGPGIAAARTLTHKRLFREFLRRAGLPCPHVLDAGDGEAGADRLFDECRWLVKPNRSSGSKGVFVVDNRAQLEARIAESRRFSIDGQALLEEFVDGSQHTLEAIVRDGRLALALLTDRDTVPPPHTATRGHRVPSRLSEQRRRDAVEAIEQVLRLTGVRDGPLDCDFVADNERIVLIEMTPRLGGNSLSRLFEASLDVDLVSAAVRHACGDRVALPPARQPRPAAVVILGAERAGRVRWDAEQARLLAREPWLRTLLFDVAQGDAVDAFINGRHRVGEALVVGSTRDEVDARLTELAERLQLDVE